MEARHRNKVSSNVLDQSIGQAVHNVLATEDVSENLGITQIIVETNIIV